MDIHEGDQVEFTIEAPERIGLRKLPSAGLSAGALRHLGQGKPVSVDAMDAAVRKSIWEIGRARNEALRTFDKKLAAELAAESET